MALFTWPLSFIFKTVVSVRNSLYNLGIFKQHKVGAPVISVGNVTVGGTGKSPIVLYLKRMCDDLSICPSIVSRGYGGSVVGPALLPKEYSEDLAQKFGDEPSMYRKADERLPIAVGADRVMACKHLLESDSKIDLVIADDAFQHRRLYRDLNFVVIDATRPLKDYRLLPAGKAREGLQSLARADLVFLSKSNLIRDDEKKQIIKTIEEYKRSETSIVEIDYQIVSFESFLAPSTIRNHSEFSDEKVVLVSALGNPAAFEKTVKVQSGAEIVKHFVFRDHHKYSSEEVSGIIRYCHENKVQNIILTEKDAVKLSAIEWRGVEVWISRLDLKINNKDQEDDLRSLMKERLVGNEQ